MRNRYETPVKISPAVGRYLAMYSKLRQTCPNRRVAAKASKLIGESLSDAQTHQVACRQQSRGSTERPLYDNESAATSKTFPASLASVRRRRQNNHRYQQSDFGIELARIVSSMNRPLKSGLDRFWGSPGLQRSFRNSFYDRGEII